MVRSDPENGNFLQIEVKITNRLDEAIIVHGAALELPKRGYIGLGSNKSEFGRTEIIPGHGGKRSVVPNWEIAGKGSFHTLYERPTRMDLGVKTVYVFPPSSWKEGFLKVTLIVSGKSLTIRDKKMVISRRITAMMPNPEQKTASNTN